MLAAGALTLAALEIQSVAGAVALCAALLGAGVLALRKPRTRAAPPPVPEVDHGAIEKLAAQNAELSTLLWKTVDRLQVLSAIDRDFSEQTLDLDALLQAIAARTCEAVGDVVGVYLHDEHQPALRGFAAGNPERLHGWRPIFEVEPAFELPSLARLVMRTGATRSFEDVQRTAEAFGTVAERDAYRRVPDARFGLAAPIRSRGGEAVGAVLVLRGAEGPPFSQDDIELTEQVADRAALAIDNGRLYRARETFLGLAAHELRTPTTALRAQAQLMLRRLESLPVERVRAGLENIERQTGRLTRLINDLLDVTRIEAAKLELRQERVDGGALATELVERFEQVTSRRCFRREGVAHAYLRADPVRLDQVLSNLLTNAVKFCQEGDILVRAEEANGEVIFSVVDHGPGITRDKQMLLFERFSQLGHDGDRRGGLGLGLYLSRELVLRMGGRIWIESDGVPGHPTAFRIAFPAAAADAPRAAANVLQTDSPAALLRAASQGEANGAAVVQPPEDAGPKPIER